MQTKWKTRRRSCCHWPYHGVENRDINRSKAVLIRWDVPKLVTLKCRKSKYLVRYWKFTNYQFSTGKTVDGITSPPDIDRLQLSTSGNISVLVSIGRKSQARTYFLPNLQQRLMPNFTHWTLFWCGKLQSFWVLHRWISKLYKLILSQIGHDLLEYYLPPEFS